MAAYAHGSLSLGAVVAAMIATSGDEAFVMFALIPRDALVLTALLLVGGLIAGRATDLFAGRRAMATARCCQKLQVHGEECNCFPRRSILSQWRRCSLSRGLLAVALSLVLLATMLGFVGPDRWNWIRITVVITTAVALFIASTVKVETGSSIATHSERMPP